MGAVPSSCPQVCILPVPLRRLLPPSEATFCSQLNPFWGANLEGLDPCEMKHTTPPMIAKLSIWTKLVRLMESPFQWRQSKYFQYFCQSLKNSRNLLLFAHRLIFALHENFAPLSPSKILLTRTFLFNQLEPWIQITNLIWAIFIWYGLFWIQRELSLKPSLGA